MNKAELRNEFIKQIPKAIISGKQQSYADWLEDKIISISTPIEKPNFCSCDLPNFVGLNLDKSKPCPYCGLPFKLTNH